jgi:arsenate reductase (glutaredoxin)
MAMKFYAYHKCSTCTRAQKLLNKKKRGYEAIDITQLPPTAGELDSMLQLVNGEVRRLFNVSGKVYREMNLGQKLPELSNAQALKLLAKNGKLIKRPMLFINGVAKAVGFNEKEWDALL